jgi:hypothetical protein
LPPTSDIAGYSRLMGEGDRDLKGHQAVVRPLVGRYGGRVIDTAGDGILAEFPSVINATECAVEIQTIMATRNEGVPESRRMRCRIGINLGDVIHDETRIYGDGINVAAWLEGIAEPGGICISRQVFDQVSRALKANFQALGPRTLKNVAQPVDVFAIAPADGGAGPGVTAPNAVDLTQEIRFCAAPDEVQLRLLDDRAWAALDEDGELDDPPGIRSREPDLAASLSGGPHAGPLRRSW